MDAQVREVATHTKPAERVPQQIRERRKGSARKRGKTDKPAGSRHPRPLPHGRGPIREQAQRVRRDHVIEMVATEFGVGRVHAMEIDVAHADACQFLLQAIEHRGRQIDRDHAAARTHRLRERQRNCAGARRHIQNLGARLGVDAGHEGVGAERDEAHAALS